jgi:hypothetical protein
MAPPLTHHDIIRHATPLTRRGAKINLVSCDRAERYLEFQPQHIDIPDARVTYALQIGAGNMTLVSRILAHCCGVVSTLNAVVTDVDAALDVFDAIPLTRQLSVQADSAQARSYSLESIPGSQKAASELKLRFVCAQVAGLELQVDTSTGGAMPADVRVLIKGQHVNYLREILADGEDSPLRHRAAQTLIKAATPSNTQDVEKLRGNDLSPILNHSSYIAASNANAPNVRKLPDDILAVLGPQWRPLVNQGDHWKGVLRKLGQEPRRSKRAETRIQEAIDHLHRTLSQPAELYHEQQHQARRKVFVRRLQPVMLFIGILALMPISWLFVSGGGAQMHPLALGLTPLLMVGVVAMTAREIPVMEIPPRPVPLNAGFWTALQEIEPRRKAYC